MPYTPVLFLSIRPGAGGTTERDAMDDADSKAPRRVPFGELAFARRFAYGEQAAIAEVTGPRDRTVLGTGFARFRAASIPWTVRYDEVLLVIEGSVTVRSAAGDLEAGPLDSIWLPAGTELRYESESALVFYALHPSNWAEAEP